MRQSRRSGWAGFVALVCVLAVVVTGGLVLFASAAEPEPVDRAGVPSTGPSPAPPDRAGSAGGSSPRTSGAGGGGSGGSRTAQASRFAPPPIRELRGELEGVADAYPAFYGVVVSEPSSGRSVVMGGDEVFAAASVGKLPVLLSLYRAAALGEASLEDPITMRASDVQAYGTGVLYTRPVGHTITLRECAKLLITESDNTAWKMLTRYMGKSHVQAGLHEMGATSTEYWKPNTTTANDVALMLQKISDPAYTSPELSAEMLDFMTNTSFEDRIPAPLPRGTRVAHKIGYYGDTFSDAGIVFPEGSKDPRDAYYIVVLSAGTTEGASRLATQEMSLATYEYFTDSESPKADR